MSLAVRVAVVDLIGGTLLLWLQSKSFPRPLFWLIAFGLLLGFVFMFLGTRDG
jgi:hypothetical protein